MAWDDRSGDFCYLDYTMVPYQHHRIRSIWKVVVTQNFRDSKVRETGVTNVVAHTAREAAKRGAEQFAQHVAAMEDSKKRDKLRRKEERERAKIVSD